MVYYISVRKKCINARTFKFVNNNCPFYLNEIFEFTPHCRIDARNSFAKLKHPFHKTDTGQKTFYWKPFKTIKKRNNSKYFQT